jgi:hypothetical protein
MTRTLAIALLGMLPLSAVARAEPRHTPIDEIGTPLPAGGRVAPAPPRASAATLPGLVPSSERDAVSDLGLLRRTDGSFAFADPGARFTAVVRLDGSVMFADRWRRPNAKDRQHGKRGGLPPEGARALNPFVGVRLSGPLEWALAATRQDPYAAAKAGFLLRTEEFRRGLAVGFVRARLGAQLRALPRELLELWSDRKRDATARRKLIFQRWDECAEPSPAAAAVASASADIDAARSDTAARARAAIEAFVRRHAPAGSRHGFAPDELRRLNRSRRSADAFDPYAESTP